MAPYTKASTRCGFMRIETVSGKDKPDREDDCYGMTKGHKPSAHRVPKIEDLIKRIKPDIIVFQNGNNFFDFFKEGQIIQNDRHSKLIRAHVIPMLRWLASDAEGVKKFYWVSPPEAGNVTPEVQQFVFDVMNNEVEKIGVMLDSRKVTSYPYKNQDKDKMHFWGNAAIDWGDDIFRLIAEDLAAHDIHTTPAITERGIDFSDPLDKKAKEGEITLRLRLKAKTDVPKPETFAPYGEFLVGYLYDVLEVSSGKYTEKEMLLLHPAYIKHSAQDLSKYTIGKVTTVTVSEIGDDSLWTTVHRRDNVGSPELYPFMINDDIKRHPDYADCPPCNQ